MLSLSQTGIYYDVYARKPFLRLKAKPKQRDNDNYYKNLPEQCQEFFNVQTRYFFSLFGGRFGLAQTAAFSILNFYICFYKEICVYVHICV